MAAAVAAAAAPTVAAVTAVAAAAAATAVRMNVLIHSLSISSAGGAARSHRALSNGKLAASPRKGSPRRADVHRIVGNWTTTASSKHHRAGKACISHDPSELLASDAYHGFAICADPAHICRCVFQSFFWQRLEQYLALRHRPHNLPESTGSRQNQHMRLRPLLTSVATASSKASTHLLALTNNFLSRALFS